MAGEVLYFISDTHLGDGSGADRFIYPNQLMELLFRIESEPGAHLVLLGDIMELWAASLEAVLSQHAPVFYAIVRIAASHPVTYVVGNHDCLPWYYFLNQSAGQIRIVERLTDGRGALVALHGHQFDPYNQVKLLHDGGVKAPWTRKLVQLIGFLGRVGGDATGDAIADIGERLSKGLSNLEDLLPHWDPGTRLAVSQGLQEVKLILEREAPGERGYPTEESIYDEAAVSFIRQGARYVVMGHTHHPLVRSYGNRTYVNTGSWVWTRYPPTYGRLASGRLELFDANTHMPYEPAQPGEKKSHSS